MPLLSLPSVLTVLLPVTVLLAPAGVPATHGCTAAVHVLHSHNRDSSVLLNCTAEKIQLQHHIPAHVQVHMSLLGMCAQFTQPS
jgi:hypothetical protein